jgi:hypothetical protein
MWPPQKQRLFGFDPKYSVTTLLATYAAVVSTVALYFNTLRVADDLRLSIETVDLSYDQASDLLSASANLALVNAGNQTEVVEQVYWYARWGKLSKPKECISENPDIGYVSRIDGDFAPLALKPGDTSRSTTKIKFLDRFGYPLENGDVITVCLAFALFTPSGITVSPEAFGISYHYGVDGKKQSYLQVIVHKPGEDIRVDSLVQTSSILGWTLFKSSQTPARPPL